LRWWFFFWVGGGWLQEENLKIGFEKKLNGKENDANGNPNLSSGSSGLFVSGYRALASLPLFFFSLSFLHSKLIQLVRSPKNAPIVLLISKRHCSRKSAPFDSVQAGTGSDLLWCAIIWVYFNCIVMIMFTFLLGFFFWPNWTD